MTLVNKNICVKILFHANIRARKVAHLGNYFSRRNNFHLIDSRFPSLSCSVIFDQINADLLIRRVSYLYLITSMCPIVFPYPVSTGVDGVRNDQGQTKFKSGFHVVSPNWSEMKQTQLN